MKKLTSIILVLLFCFSCEKSEFNPERSLEIETRSSHKVFVCHQTDDINNPFKLIEVSQKALRAHLDHGDYVAFDLYIDRDYDGYGAEKLEEKACEVNSGYSAVGGDCDDENAAVNPSATEICDNGMDDDCDGQVDEADSDCPDTPDDGLLRVSLPNGEILVVHPTDNAQGIPWGRNGNNILGLSDITSYPEVNYDFNGIGNTQAIVQQLLSDYNYGYYAAKLCDDLIAYGFDDWYLPATGELNAMFAQLGPNSGSGDIIRGVYWSSTEASSDRAWKVYFDGSKFHDEKNERIRCRCVRK